MMQIEDVVPLSDGTLLFVSRDCQGWLHSTYIDPANRFSGDIIREALSLGFRIPGYDTPPPPPEDYLLAMKEGNPFAALKSLKS